MEIKNYGEYKDNHLIYNHRAFYNLDQYNYGSQIHDIFELLYLKNGDLNYTVEGKNFRAEKNTLILTPPDKQHLLQYNHLQVYDRYDVLFDETIVPAEIWRPITNGIDVLHLEGSPFIVELFEKMDYYCKYFKGETLKRILSHLTEEILYNIAVDSQKLLQEPSTAHPIVMQAVEYIDKNLQKDLDLDELCRELFITKSYLHQLFTKYLKISPKKYIITKQLALAQREIREGAHPTTLYTDCGFSNYSTFYRAYKNHFGYSPSEEMEKTAIRETLL